MGKIKIDTDKIFEENKDVNKLYKTSDGQVFIRENRAKLHANSLPQGKQKVKEITSNDVKNVDVNGAEELNLKSADKIIEWSKESKSPDILSEYLKAENNRKTPRKTVVEALEERLEELKTDK